MTYILASDGEFIVENTSTFKRYNIVATDFIKNFIQNAECDITVEDSHVKFQMRNNALFVVCALVECGEFKL